MGIKIDRNHLTEIASFNSGFVSGGIDYWTIYLHLEFPDLIFIHSEGSNFGWEYDTWEYCKKSGDELLNFLQSEKENNVEKCQRIIETERFSVHDLGLSYP
ncbi:MAG: hypothetical protein IPM77_18685 [Crocinitomicaceae bacterium]|nr:hypothetical protein [Crocinitomicaceae bacterium]